MELSSENVSRIFMDCLYENREDDEIIVYGIVNGFSLNPNKIDEHKSDIYLMLKQLPKQFHKDSGGGWSFLNACNDKNGKQWGEHRSMEQLFVLGMACKLVRCLLPRKFWETLPGGMPYYIVE